MQAEINQLRAKLEQQRRTLGGVHAARDGYQQRQRKLGMLEGRLEKTLARREEAVAANRALRGEIEGLRRERLRFMGVHQRLEKKAAGCDKEMAAAIEACNSAYEQRDAAQVCVCRVYDLCYAVEEKSKAPTSFYLHSHADDDRRRWRRWRRGSGGSGRRIAGS